MLELENSCLTCCQQAGTNFLAIQGRKTDEIQDVLGKHFWYTEIDFLGAIICQICWDQVNSFHRLYVSAQELYRSRLVSVVVKSEPSVGQDDRRDGSPPERFSIKFVDKHEDSEHVFIKKEVEETVKPGEEIGTNMVSLVVKSEPVESGQFHLSEEGHEKTQTYFSSNNFEEDVAKDAVESAADDDEDDFEDMQSTDGSLEDRNKPLGGVSRNRQRQLDDDFIRQHIRYICQTCGQESKTFAGFLNHAKEHATKSAFLDCCGLRFRQKHRLLDHVQNLGKSNSRQQRLQLFKTVEYRQQDDEQIRQHVKCICNLCGHESPTFAQFVHHSLHVHSNKSAFIVCCGMKYFTKSRLRDHVKSIINPEAFRCEQCQKNFKSRDVLVRHMIDIHATKGEPKYKCEKCPKRFTTEGKYKRHKWGHAACECEHCGQSYKTRHALAKHISKKHVKQSSINFTCDICSKGFRKKWFYMQHQLMHDKAPNTEKIQCDVCLRWLKNNHSWRTHMWMHRKTENDDRQKRSPFEREDDDSGEPADQSIKPMIDFDGGSCGVTSLDGAEDGTEVNPSAGPDLGWLKKEPDS